jgi:hypothetical protein
MRFGPMGLFFGTEEVYHSQDFEKGKYSNVYWFYILRGLKLTKILLIRAAYAMLTRGRVLTTAGRRQFHQH